jgi:hypothetical protein
VTRRATSRTRWEWRRGACGGGCAICGSVRCRSCRMPRGPRGRGRDPRRRGRARGRFGSAGGRGVAGSPGAIQIPASPSQKPTSVLERLIDRVTEPRPGRPRPVLRLRHVPRRGERRAAAALSASTSTSTLRSRRSRRVGLGPRQITPRRSPVASRRASITPLARPVRHAAACRGPRDVSSRRAAGFLTLRRNHGQPVRMEDTS